MSASPTFRTATSALRWAYRVLMLAGLGAALVAYQQGRGGTAHSDIAADLEQALSGLKELARVLQ